MSPTILTLLALPVVCTAYSWKFDNTPQQCKNLTVSISGSGGNPPYRLLILPFGPSPLPNNIEARKIVDKPFSDNSNTISFQLNYPGLSQFVAVVSDATGFGSGGTSVAAMVTDSSDKSCFDYKANVSPLFVFSIDPPNQIVQCEATRIWWSSASVQGTPNFLGVIPGGQSFSVPTGSITNVDGQGTGFSWTPSLRGGTTLILVGGDDRGNGTAGSVLNTVSSGVNNNNNCLNSNSPSSTPGTPAGGSYPTSPSGGVGGGGASGGNSTNVGAIVGGVVGGLVAIAIILLLLIFFQRRRSNARSRHEKRALDLLNAEDEEDMQNGHGLESNAAQGARRSRNDLPEYYQPQPFTVPDPTLSSTHDLNSEGRPLSSFTETDRHTSTTDFLNSLYSGIPGEQAGQGSSVTGRKGPLRQMRPVNVFQHDDAGPSEAPDDAQEPETVELPPAYSNIRK